MRHLRSLTPPPPSLVVIQLLFFVFGLDVVLSVVTVMNKDEIECARWRGRGRGEEPLPPPYIEWHGLVVVVVGEEEESERMIDFPSSPSFSAVGDFFVPPYGDFLKVFSHNDFFLSFLLHPSTIQNPTHT